MANNPPDERLPQEWCERLANLSGPLDLQIAGYGMTVEVTPAQLESAYLPALALLARAAGLRQKGTGSERNDSVASDNGMPRSACPLLPSRRILAGLAGIPAGGKSVFAAVLQSLADRLLAPGILVAVGMDGWHYPNAVLDSLAITDAAGQRISLRQRKGCPLSFDVAALIANLKRLASATQNVQLPVYDRRLHEPLPDALTITPTARIVLLEGNYVLGHVPGCPQWDDVAALLRPKIFLECSPDLARERIIARHIRGDATPEAARRKYELNDRSNTQTVLSAAKTADIRTALE